MQVTPKQENKKTILVVDDEEDLREIIGFELSDAGYEVLLAENGTQAFELVKARQIDLIISDIRMPNGDGVSLLDNVKRQNPRHPVVLLMTGYADLSVAEAYAKGAEGFFSKPIDFPALLASIARHLSPIERRLTRLHERYDVSLQVGLEFASHKLRSDTLNIGRGGMFVVLTGQPPDTDDLVEFNICFKDPARPPINGIGIVRWVRREPAGGLPVGFGLEFSELSAESLRMLVALIEGLRTKAYIPMQ